VLKLASAMLLGWGMIGFAQEQPKKAQPPAPPMRVNILNVCAPNEAEQKEIAAALGRVPQRPSFGRDYEITRGHTTAEDGADWVRIRREFPKAMPLLAVQFSYSVDPKNTLETAVFYSREAKDVMQVALEDQVASGTSPAAVLAADTPVSHIRIERFGKPSLVLARCGNVDQTAYEPLFRTASQIMAAYRARLDAKQIVPSELGRGPGGGHRPAGVKPMGRPRAPESKP
jgi:predicted nuclease of predicted toxin-antitoxin system